MRFREPEKHPLFGMKVPPILSFLCACYSENFMCVFWEMVFCQKSSSPGRFFNKRIFTREIFCQKRFSLRKFFNKRYGKTLPSYMSVFPLLTVIPFYPLNKCFRPCPCREPFVPGFPGLLSGMPECSTQPFPQHF